MRGAVTRARRAAARARRVVHLLATGSSMLSGSPRRSGTSLLRGLDAAPARLTLMALVLCAATMWGCDKGTASQSEPERPRTVADLVLQVTLGHTTADDAERQFGAPDERAPDGSLVYRFQTVRGRGGQPQTETETVT